RHAEIRSSFDRTECAGLSELAHNRAGAGLLVSNQHYLGSPRTDSYYSSNDSTASNHRHVDGDSRTAANVDRDGIEPDRRIAGDDSSRDILDVALLIQIQQGFETFIFSGGLLRGVKFRFNLGQSFFELFVLACSAAEIPDLLKETGGGAASLRRSVLQRGGEGLGPDAQNFLPSVGVSGVNRHDDEIGD